MAATKKTAATKTTDDQDVISRIAGKGEETLRWLVGTPHRMVTDVRGGVDARLHDLAGKLRSIDPLDGRVADLERRLGALEKPAKKARAMPARAKPSATTGQRDDAPAGGENAPNQ
jgi:hypothetical protein